jgi:hypothetical protein
MGVLLGGLLFGVLGRGWSRMLDQALTVKSLGFYGFGVMVLFVGIRSMIEIVILTYPLVCWIVVDRLVRLGSGGGRAHAAYTVARQPTRTFEARGWTKRLKG